MSIKVLNEQNIKSIVNTTVGYVRLMELYMRLNNISYINENIEDEAYAATFPADFNDIASMWDELFSYAKSLTRNLTAAEELTQDTVERAMIKSDQFEDNTNLLAWLRTIMYNIFRRSKSNEKRRQMNYLDDYTPYEKKFDRSEDVNAVEPEFFEQLREKISASIQKLADEKKDPNIKKVLDLKLQKQKSEDIANQLGVNLERIKYILKIIRKRLNDDGIHQEYLNSFIKNE